MYWAHFCGSGKRLFLVLRDMSFSCGLQDRQSHSCFTPYTLTVCLLALVAQCRPRA